MTRAWCTIFPVARSAFFVFALANQANVNSLAVEDPETQFNVTLIRRTAQGDEQAFRTLYERFAPVLYGMAFRIMNDAKEAEDALQEGFTYIWNRASAFDPSLSNPFSWAALIVRNKAIDRLRARRRTDRLRDKFAAEKADFTDVDERSALEPALRERYAQVRTALGQIAPEQRQVLELAFFGGLTHEEIAESLEMPLGTAKARIRRGLIRLRELLYEEA